MENKNIKLNHNEEFEKIEKISREMKTKTKDSRQYKILNKRIKKIYDNIIRYRSIRYKEKSVEYLNKLKEEN